MAQLIADVFHAAFDNDWLRPGNDQAAFDVAGGPHGDDHRRLCRFAAVLSRRRHRLAGRARHDQRRRHGRREAALSVRELHPRGRLSARRSRAHRAKHGRRRRARPACRSSPATPRSSSAARPTACSSPRPASASCPPGFIFRATGRGPATSFCCRARSAITASRSCRSARISRSRRKILSDSAALHGLVADMVAAVGASIRADARPDARRPRGDAERNRASVAASAFASRRRPSRCGRRSRRPANCSASIRCIVANEGKLVAFVAPEAAEALLAAMRAHPLGRDARSSARWSTTSTASCR